MGFIKDLITTFIGDHLIEVMKSGTDIITEEVCQVANNKILEYLCTEYERNYKTKTILHRSEPVELEKFYQPLYLHKVSPQWGRHSIVEDSNRINTEKAEPLFQKGNCITIIGTAGSGKSTLVKYLFVDAIKSNFRIPIKVELRYLNNYNGNLISYIKDEIIKFSEIAQSERIVERLLNSGQFVVFFDGYDEIASNRKEEITKDICKVTKKYKSNKYILTSRPFVSVDMLENFCNYQVCDLTLDEIKSFVRKQFNDSEKELAEKIIETISNEDAHTYNSFLSNPLLLSMFIITYQTDSNIPQKRSDYYNQVFNTLYSVHDTSSKLGFVREKKTGMSKENFVDILKRFSFKSFFSHNYTFSVVYFETEMQGIKRDLNLEFSNEDLLTDLEVAIGILTQEGVEITFPHRSLQEYFAALFVTSLTYENKLKLYKYLYDQFNDILNNRVLQNDNVNFFSLLSEMDKISFYKELIIPVLKELKIKIASLKGIEVIDAFGSIREISFLFDDGMRDNFRDEHLRYNQLFDDYLRQMRKEKQKKFDHKDFENARLMLANNDILPFLQGYNYDEVINKIEDSIKKTEQIDSAFINNLF